MYAYLKRYHILKTYRHSCYDVISKETILIYQQILHQKKIFFLKNSSDLLYIRERLIDDAPLSFFISCPNFLSQKKTVYCLCFEIDKIICIKIVLLYSASFPVILSCDEMRRLVALHIHEMLGIHWIEYIS